MTAKPRHPDVISADIAHITNRMWNPMTTRGHRQPLPVNSVDGIARSRRDAKRAEILYDQYVERLSELDDELDDACEFYGVDP